MNKLAKGLLSVKETKRRRVQRRIERMMKKIVLSKPEATKSF